MVGLALAFLLSAQILLEVERRRTALLRLAASESRYRSLFENNHAVMLLIDPGDGSIVDANPAAARFYGWSRDQLRRKTITEINELAPEEVLNPLEEAPSGHDRVFTFRHRLADGSVRDVEVLSGSIESDGRDLLYSIIRDISRRTRAEQAARRHHAMLARTEEIARVGSWEWEIATDRVTWSDELFRIFGLEPAAEAPPFAEHQAFYLAEDRARLVAAVAGCAREGTPYVEDVRIERADGQVRHCTVRGLAEREADGRITRLVGSLHDITERKESEAEQAKLREQLTQAQKLESVGRLAGGVAHDFNNMLNVILGHAELALEEVGPDPSLRVHLDQVIRSAERSANLTRQLLAFARKQVASPRVLDLESTVDSMLRMLGRLIGEDVDLVWRPASTPSTVVMDPAQVDQILANLCVNARDAIGQRPGKITIETGQAEFDRQYCEAHAGLVPGSYAVLTVSDDGCGMDRETLQSIFEPFFTTKGVGEGTGLGLATVYGIVKQNQGFINVYSEPGQGTVFRIYLPRQEGRADRSGARAVAMPAGGDETVLVVEDEASILDLTRTMLARLGYRVLTAGAPAEAIQLARAHAGTIDLLITDVVMPGMNGRDLVDALHAHHPDLRCLFMSGYTADVIAHRGVLEDGVHFIQKPFSTASLAAKVREALASAGRGI